MDETTVAQRQRTKGWRAPVNSVCVSRPARWGNPWVIQRTRTGWRVIRPHHQETTHFDTHDAAVRFAAVRFHRWLSESTDPEAAWIREHAHELGGKTLLCWCPQPGPCHAHSLALLADINAQELDRLRSAT